MARLKNSFLVVNIMKIDLIFVFLSGLRKRNVNYGAAKQHSFSVFWSFKTQLRRKRNGSLFNELSDHRFFSPSLCWWSFTFVKNHIFFYPQSLFIAMGEFELLKKINNTIVINLILLQQENQSLVKGKHIVIYNCFMILHLAACD